VDNDEGVDRGHVRHRAQSRLRLDRDDLGDGRGVMPEVDSAPGADFEHASRQARQQQLPVYSAFTLGDRGRSRKTARKKRPG
jgi:hypothetical protein